MTDWEDPDDPQDIDLDDEHDDDASVDTVPCPSCGLLIYDQTEQCPICGRYVTPRLGLRRKGTLTTTIVILMVLLILLFSVC